MPEPLLIYTVLLMGSAILCVLLEAVGVPVAFRKGGTRPHIVLLALVSVLFSGAFLYINQEAFFSLELVYLKIDRIILYEILALHGVFAVSIALCFVQMRLLDEERGEAYAFLLAALLCGSFLLMCNDLVYLTCLAPILWALLAPLAIFRGKRRLSAELFTKMIFLSLVWFLLMSVVLLCVALLGQGTSFDALFVAISSSFIAVKIALVILLVALVWWMGLGPLYFLHVDVLSGAPFLMAYAFYGSVSICGLGIFARIMAALPAEDIFVQGLLQFILVMTQISCILPAIRAIDQVVVSRGIMYLIVMQPALLLMQQILQPQMGEERLFLASATVLVAILGTLAGVHYWKTKGGSEKSFEEYAGAGRKHPLSAIIWLLSLASLVGQPATGAFLQRLEVAKILWEKGELVWAALPFVGMIFGASFVIRVGIFLFAKEIRFDLEELHQPRQGVVLIGSGVILLFLNLYAYL